MAFEIRNSFQASEELWLVFENEGFSLTHFLFKTQPGSQARESPPVVAFNIIQYSTVLLFEAWKAFCSAPLGGRWSSGPLFGG